MTLREGVRALLLLVGILGATGLFWEFGRIQSVRMDSGGPITWLYAISALPCGLATFHASRRLPRQIPPRLVVGTLVLSAAMAAVIALATGTIVTLTAVNLPFFGASFGWQISSLVRALPGNESG